MKKILAVLICLALSLSALAGCNDLPDADTESSKDSNEATESATESETKPEESETPPLNGDEANMGLPNGIDYGGKDVNVLGWDESFAELFIKAPQFGLPSDDAVFKRCIYAEEALGVLLRIKKLLNKSSSASQAGSALVDEVAEYMSDPTKPIDIFALPAYATSYAAIRGICVDLSANENIDLSKSWWPDNIENDVSMGGKIYFVTGDMSTNSLMSLKSINMNKTMADKYGAGNVVRLVKDKEWTVDKMIELSNTAAESMNGSGEYASTLDYWSLEDIYGAAGMKIVVGSNNKDELISMSDDIFGSSFIGLFDKLAAWTKNEGVFVDTEHSGNAEKQFVDGKALMYIGDIGCGRRNFLHEKDSDYYILPLPMLNEGGDYLTPLTSGIASYYSVATTCTDTARAGAVLTALGYFGEKAFHEMIYETEVNMPNLDESGREMLGIIFDSMTVNMDGIFGHQFSDIHSKITLGIVSGLKWPDPLIKAQIEREVKNINAK